MIHKENKVQMIFNNKSQKAENFIANVLLQGNNLHIWLNALKQLQAGEDCIVTKTFTNQKDAKLFFNNLVNTFNSL